MKPANIGSPNMNVYVIVCFYAQDVCMHMHTGFYVFPFSSRAEITYSIQVKTKCKISILILDQNQTLFPMVFLLLL